MAKKKTTEYTIWSSMKARCLNNKSPFFSDYGGRGIKVCERWMSFEPFLADMGPRPTNHHTLDRIDVNGDYTPKNCRWATWSEQAKNKRNTVRLTFRGQTLNKSDWAMITGVQHETINWRLRQGMSVEEALTKPVRKQRKYSRRKKEAGIVGEK